MVPFKKISPWFIQLRGKHIIVDKRATAALRGLFCQNEPIKTEPLKVNFRCSLWPENLPECTNLIIRLSTRLRTVLYGIIVAVMVPSPWGNSFLSSELLISNLHGGRRPNSHVNGPVFSPVIYLWFFKQQNYFSVAPAAPGCIASLPEPYLNASFGGD